MARKIEGGYILLARNIIESEIWEKPAAYLKVWIYILSKVNWKTSKKNPIGSEYFNFRQLKIPGVTQSQMYEFLRWAKKLNPTDSTTQLTTEKTTRGTYLQVTKYAYYQDVKNYVHQNTYQQTHQQITNTIPKTVNKREIINNLSLEEREILKNYLLSRPRKEPIYDWDAYLSELKKSNTLKAKLDKALKWNQKQIEKAQRKQSEENIPPAENFEKVQEDKAVTDAARNKARARVNQIRKNICNTKD